MRRKYIPMVIIFIFLMTMVSLKTNGESEVMGRIQENQLVAIGNDDLQGEASSRNWTGNGTENNPYVVENKYFVTNWTGASIFIEGVSLHLLFRNCTITDDGNVSFTILIGNAYIGSSSNIRFEGCNFISNTIQGARFEGSNNCSIVNSTLMVHGEEFGISFDNCKDIRIEKCSMIGGSEMILYFSNSMRMELIDSTIDLNYNGIGLENVWNSVISNNTFQEGSQHQVYIFYCTNVSLDNNLFTGYSYACTYFYSSERCNFRRNSVQETSVGCYLIYTSNSTFSDNVIVSHYFPFYGDGGYNNRFFGNVMTNSSLYLRGTTDQMRSMEVTDDNLVNGLPLLYIKDRDLGGAEVRKNVGTIFLVNVSNARITDRTFNRTYSPINLLGCRGITAQDCIIENSADGVVAKDCSNIILKNFKGNPFQTGFHIERCNDSVIMNNNFERCYGSIYMTNSHRNRIENNRFIKNENVISIHLSDDNSLIDNTINGSIEISTSYRNLIERNVIIDGDLNINHDILWDHEQPEPRGNIVNGVRKEYYLHRTNENVEVPDDVDWLILFNLTRCSISNIEMENGYGIEIHYSNSLTIHDSTFVSPMIGINILNSVRTNVIDCEFIGDDGQGIKLVSSSSCRIEGNLLDQKMRSIDLRYCQGVEIVANRIQNSVGNGISLSDDTDGSFILRNMINNSGDTGIVLSATTESLISGNYIMNSEDYGIRIYNGAERNRIYYNHFEFNRGSIDMYNDIRRQARDDGRSNYWYYDAPGVSVGNFWSDYQAPDEDEDGRVDFVYTTDGYQSSYDLYPMVKDFEEKDPNDPRGSSEVWIAIFFVVIIVWLIVLVAYKYFSHHSN